MPVFFFWKEYVKGFYILKLRTRIRMCKLWRTRPDGQGILAMVLLLRQKPPKVWIPRFRPRFRPRRIHRTVGFLKSILAFEDISYWQHRHRYDGKKMKHQMVDAGIGMPVFFFESVWEKNIFWSGCVSYVWRTSYCSENLLKIALTDMKLLSRQQDTIHYPSQSSKHSIQTFHTCGISSRKGRKRLVITGSSLQARDLAIHGERPSSCYQHLHQMISMR